MTRTRDAKRPPGTRLYAVTPSLGVRLWLEHGRVCLHAASEGGRGRPLGLAVLPLRPQSDGSLRLDLDVTAFAAAAAAGATALRTLLEPHVVLRDEPSAGPIVTRHSPAEWDRVAGAHSLALVLLLFWQRDPQEADRTPLAPMDADDPRAWNDVWRALEAASIGENASWRRGVVHLDPADRPLAPGATRDGPPPPLVFALGSCQYPAGLTDATPAPRDDVPAGPPGPADASMLRLGKRLRRFGDPARPGLLVLAGDQVYVDETAGLFDPRAGAVPVATPGDDIDGIDGDWLRMPYRNWLGSAGAQSVLGLVPNRMMLDDHEIDDNWARLPPTAAPRDAELTAALRRAGLAAYGRWQRDRARPSQWHRHEQRGIGFFLADTRSERQARRAAVDPLGLDAPRLMSARQERALHAWLRRPRDRPAFVVSPSMLLPRRRISARSARGGLHSDAWDGYPRCLHALLAAIWRAGRSDLVFLSGDEHLSSVTRITLTDLAATRTVALHSIHSSGLYAPYPFANSVPEEFAAPDRWCFEDPRAPGAWYVCEVSVSHWVPGDGFAVLALAEAAAGGWRLDVEFDRARDASVALSLALSPPPLSTVSPADRRAAGQGAPRPAPRAAPGSADGPAPACG